MSEISTILELRKFAIPEVVFGSGSRTLAGRYARNLGVRKVLVVTDPGIFNAGWAQKVISSIIEHDLKHVLFTDVSPNPRNTEVMDGAEIYLKEGCDAIVAVGGGSPMDCAKGIGIVATNMRDILDFEGVDNVEKPGPPLICLPTTAGSSADVSQFAIINDTQRKVKIAIVSKTMIPDTALLDPVMTASMSPELTANTGLDALTHAFEAYCSNVNSPITDLHALEAIRLVRENLPLAVERPDDLNVRAKMMLGSMYAGFAFSNAILGAVHALAHSLGGLMDLPHGLCNAILLDHVVSYNFCSAPTRYAAVGRALGAGISDHMPVETAEPILNETLRGFKQRVGVTATLGDLGMREEDIDKLAEYAMQDACMITNPREATIEDMKNILRRAL